MKYEAVMDLSSAELLKFTCREDKVVDDLILHYGGLRRLSEAPLPELLSLGLSKVRASKLMAVLEFARRFAAEPESRVKITCPQDVAALLRDMEIMDRECFRVVCLNAKNFVLTVSTVSIGTLDSSMAHPREVFKPAIARSAASLICAHNHPGSLGEVEPSPQDIALTRRLVDAGTLIGIPVLDHIIIGTGGRFVSLKELRQMN